MAGPRAQDGGARRGGCRHLSDVATGPSVTAALLDASIGGSGRWRRRRRSCPLRCGLCAVTKGRHVASKGPRIPVCGHWAELDLAEIFVNQWLPYPSFYSGSSPAPDIWYR
ncbi:uncharacterized protein LOC144604136 isoform X3 [Rhinoraja longicauda]